MRVGMATAPTALSIAEFLSRSYEKPEPEYVAGEVLDRSMPKDAHSQAQAELCVSFGVVRRKHTLFIRPELRVRTGEESVRVIDVAIYTDKPNAPIPSNPPLIAVEILSPDDRAHVVLEKLNEYSAWGVRHVWLVDPESREMFAWDGRSLAKQDALVAAEVEASLSPNDVFGPAAD